MRIVLRYATILVIALQIIGIVSAWWVSMPFASGSNAPGAEITSKDIATIRYVLIGMIALCGVTIMMAIMAARHFLKAQREGVAFVVATLTLVPTICLLAVLLN